MTVDHVADVMAAVGRLVSRDVLVGVPEAKTERQAEEKRRPVTNALIGYAMEFGLPDQNVPARPHLLPGIKAANEGVAKYLGQAGKAALVGDTAGVDRALHAAGLLASASVKRKITEGPFEPLAPATIAARFRQRGTKSRRKGEEFYRALVAGGMEAWAAQEFAGIHPLINTGQYRNSITYVVR